MPDMNWSQNIGSALILCLSTISVILQPLLSKFSFLINLVSRNSSFSSPPYYFHLICISWQMFLLFSCVHDHCHYCHSFLFYWVPLLAMSQSSSTFAQCLQRWWNGFHQLITCLNHNAICLLQPVQSFDLSFSLCHINPTQVPYLCFLYCLCILLEFPSVLSVCFGVHFLGLMALHEVNV